MKCSWIFAATALLCGVQGASIGGETPKLGAEPHLIGGSRVNPMGHEYSVLLRLQLDYNKYEYCQGVRLNENWLLTAAECLDQKKYTHVRFTVINNMRFVKKFFIARALEYVIHPNYDATTKQHNIGLIRQNIGEWKDQSQYPALPSRQDDVNKLISTTAEVYSVETSSVLFPKTEEEFQLQMLTVEFAGIEVCTGVNEATTYKDSSICATPYYKAKPRGLGQGNLGAPVITKDKTIYGIASQVKGFTEGAAESMIFLRTSPYLDWIHNTTGIAIQD